MLKSKKKAVKKPKVPGKITVLGGGIGPTKIPIARGHLIRIQMMCGYGKYNCFHATSYNGKDVEVFIGGPARIMNIEKPK